MNESELKAAVSRQMGEFLFAVEEAEELVSTREI